MEGLFWVNYAWQARTSRTGDQVSEDGGRLCAERLEKAQAALERAYVLDPYDPHVCYEMLRVELGQGQGRDRMERWFRRAMDADPGNHHACENKLLYLEPKWHGDAESMLEFGRQCLASGEWTARLPYFLLSAHQTLKEHAADPAEYWKQPEVWADIQSLYEAALEAKPDSVADRSAYANRTFLAEQWELADKLFRQLGDKPDLAAMKEPLARYKYMRRSAEEHARH